MTMVQGSEIKGSPSIKELVLRAAQKAYPHWADDMMQPVYVPGAYKIWAIGTPHDVTILVWHQEASDVFIVKHQAW